MPNDDFFTVTEWSIS